MKRFAHACLVLAVAIATSAQAQYQDDRGYGYDEYETADPAYGDGYNGGYGDDAAAVYDVARVVSVAPIVERGQQPVRRQECWNEPAPRYAYNDRYPQPRTSGGGAVLGAVIGGALGNQVGDGDGRDAATVLGALIGGVIGNDVERNNIRRQDAYYGRGQAVDDRYADPYAGQHEDRYNGQYAGAGGGVRRCRVVTDYRAEEQVVGYRVAYEYGGRTYETVTDFHPGSELRVRVDVTPER